MSLRRKILIAFSVLFLVFILQIAVSYGSVTSLRNDFQITTIQNDIQDTLGRVVFSHSEQSNILREYVGGFSTVSANSAIGSFFLVDNELKVNYQNLRSNISLIEEQDDALNFHTDDSLKLYNNITQNLYPSYLDIVNSTIFQSVPQILIENVITELIQIKADIGFIMTLLQNNLINHTPEGRDNVVFQIGLLSSNNIKLAELIDPVQNINASLFNTLEQARTNVSIAISSIIVSANSLNVEIYNSENITQMTDSDLQNLQNRFTNLYNKINDTTSVLDDNVLLYTNLSEYLSSSFGIADGIYNALTVELTKLIGLSSQVMTALFTNFSITTGIQIFLLFLMGGIGIFIVYIVNRLIRNDIIQPIGYISHWSEYISAGDLTKTRPSTNRLDEVGKLERNFKNMNINLRAIIQDLLQNNELIAVTSEELSSNTEEINATAEEVSAIAQSMATGSTQQAEIITTIVEELQEANDVVNSVINQITHNLSIVKDLSEQTNVLSLNTAIEASNAGEYGRGFAVIANNIRSMSDQSSRTARVITRDSKAILNQLQTTFAIITEKIENVAAVSEETAASAEEVAASAEEMTATMENIAAKSALLNDQSISSMISVNRFALTEDQLTERKTELEELDTKMKTDIVADKEFLMGDVQYTMGVDMDQSMYETKPEIDEEPEEEINQAKLEQLSEIERMKEEQRLAIEKHKREKEEAKSSSVDIESVNEVPKVENVQIEEKVVDEKIDIVEESEPQVETMEKEPVLEEKEMDIPGDLNEWTRVIEDPKDEPAKEISDDEEFTVEKADD